VGIDLPATSGVVDYPDSVWARPITWDKDFAEITLPETPPANIGNGNPPTYMIQLTITDDNGCSRTVQQSVTPGAIEVNGIATLDGINPMTDVCIPQEFELQDQVTSDNPIASWVWGFSSGDTLRAQNQLDFSLTNRPPNRRKYFATLEVEDINGCRAGVGDSIIVIDYYSLDGGILPVTKDAICAGDVVNFEAEDNTSNGLTYDWTVNNTAGDVGTSQTENITYTTEGSYEARLIYTENVTMCYDSAFKTISVQESPTTDFITSVDTEPFLCYPQTITFTDASTASSGVATLSWDFDNTETSDLNTYSTTYNQKGSYTVSLTAATSNGCETTIDKIFDIGGPEGTVSVDDDVLC